jgi:hypothetical protein
VTAYADIETVKAFARQPDALPDDQWQFLINGASRLFDNLTEVEPDFYGLPQNPRMFVGSDTEFLLIDRLAESQEIRSVTIEADAYPVPPFTLIGNVAGLADDFNDGVIDTTKWAPFTYGGYSDQITVAEQNGHFEVIMPDGPIWNFSGGGMHDAKGGLNMYGRMAEISVVQVTRSCYFALWYAWPIGVWISTDGINLLFQRKNNDNSISQSQIPYDPLITKWRMTHDPRDNSWFFSTYKNAVWTVQFHSLPADYPSVTAMGLDIQASDFSSGRPDGEKFIIDNFVSTAGDLAGTSEVMLQTLDGSLWQAPWKIFINADWAPVFEAVPFDIQYAVTEMVIHEWRKSDPAFASISNAENSILLDEIPPTAQATVDKYKAQYTQRCFFA